jgi:hypothetical protein
VIVLKVLVILLKFSVISLNISQILITIDLSILCEHSVVVLELLSVFNRVLLNRRYFIVSMMKILLLFLIGKVIFISAFVDIQVDFIYLRLIAIFFVPVIVMLGLHVLTVITLFLHLIFLLLDFLPIRLRGDILF